MELFRNCHRANMLVVLSALAVSTDAAGCASAAAPRSDESHLLVIGFMVLVAPTTFQEDWAQSLTPAR